MEFLQTDQRKVHILLELFSKELDYDGFIIEKKTKIPLTCPYSKQKIHVDSFSILPGSAVFVNNYSYCFAEHLALQRNR